MAEYIEREKALSAQNKSMNLSECRKRLERIPAADVRPVVRGKWEIYFISMLDGEGCKCSECGFEGVPYWDYCPNCGADMREES